MDKWFKQRSYAHFDRDISSSKAQALVTNPVAVAKHAFLPFIIKTPSIISRRGECLKETGEKATRLYSKKKRMVAYASHRDSHIYAYYAELLNQRLEQQYALNSYCDKAVLAYRTFTPSKSHVHFAVEAFRYIKQKGDCDLIVLDVEGFFDNIQHKQLKESWCKLLGVHSLPADHYAVFKALTQTKGISLHQLREACGGSLFRRKGRSNKRVCSIDTFREKVVPRLKSLQQLLAEVKGKNIPQGKQGIPQGISIGAVLANLYMLELDKEMSLYLHEIGGKYWRYSDDILLLVPRGRGEAIAEKLRAGLRQLGLSLQLEKVQRSSCYRRANRTRIYTRKENGEEVPSVLSYLGFDFDGEYMFVRSSTVSKFMMKAKRTLKKAYLTAKKNKNVLKRRKLYTKLTALGYGSAYGKGVYKRTLNEVLHSRRIPKQGFFKYLQIVQRVIKEIDASLLFKIEKQTNQLNHWAFRNIHYASCSLKKGACQKKEKFKLEEFDLG